MTSTNDNNLASFNQNLNINLLTIMNQSFVNQSKNQTKQDLLEWINALLQVFNCYQLNLSKIQQLCTGAVYCQIFDLVCPGKLTSSKINWAAKLQYQYSNNFKLLQNAFDRVRIQKQLQIELLAKGKTKVNYQLALWFKNFYQNHGFNYLKDQPLKEKRKIKTMLIQVTPLKHYIPSLKLNQNCAIKKKTFTEREKIGIVKINKTMKENLNMSIRIQNDKLLQKARRILFQQQTDNEKVKQLCLLFQVPLHIDKSLYIKKKNLQ